jgi:hypothetical protein
MTSIFISFQVSASSELLLDASCKAQCLTSVQEVNASQGGVYYKPIYQVTHFDLIGLSRAQIEKQSSAKSLDLICKKAFGSSLNGASSDCLYFKH